MEPFVLMPIVFILSVVQGVFGVGLLLFGTPTLLLMGVEFKSILLILLPCSLSISICQLFRGEREGFSSVPHILFFATPALVLGLHLSLNQINLKMLPPFVGGVLLFLGMLRFSERLGRLVSRLVEKNRYAYLALVGLVHGLSNMGGGLLVFYASAMSDRVLKTRTIIAVGYTVFAAVQLFTLVLLKGERLQLQNLYLIGISMFSFLLAESFIKKMKRQLHQKFLGYIIIIYGVLAVGKAII